MSDLVKVEYIGPDLAVKLEVTGQVVARAGVTHEDLASSGLAYADHAVYGGVLEVPAALAGATAEDAPPYGYGLLAQSTWRRPVPPPDEPDEKPAAAKPEPKKPAGRGRGRRVTHQTVEEQA